LSPARWEEGAFGVALTSVALSFGLTVVVLGLFVDGLEVVVPAAWILLVAGLLSLIPAVGCL
jgi:hypothetical protein